MTRDEMTARARDRAIFDGVTVQPLDPGRWVAPSASQPDSVYYLVLDEYGRAKCNCPGYQNRLVCKHAAALDAQLARKHETLADEARRLGITELEVLFR